MISLRRFNPSGLDAFTAAVDEARSKGDPDMAAILAAPSLSEQVDPEIQFAPQRFTSRRAAAEFFDKLLKPLEEKAPDLERDQGLWTWLSAAFWTVITTTDVGKSKIGATERYVLMPQRYDRYYRHLLAGPYGIFRAHREAPERVWAVLANPVDTPGELVGQVAARQDIINTPSLMEALTQLYFDSDSSELKRGQGGKGAGSSRRFADLLMQLDVTYDIYQMSADRIIELLPNEFERFKTS